MASVSGFTFSKTWMLSVIYLLCIWLTSVRLESFTCKGHFDKCLCSTTTVECHGETQLKGDNIIDLYKDISDECERIVITGSNLTEMQPNFFGSCAGAPDLILKKLTYVDLSHNNIRRVNRKAFHCVPNLDTLIMSDNQWQIDKHDNEIGYFSKFPYLKHLDLRNSFEDGTDGSIYFYKLAHIFNDTDMFELETLDLSYNEFIVLSEDSANTLCELTNIKTLNFSHNLFNEPAMPTKSDCFHALETLDLSYNSIQYLTPEFMKEVDDVHKLNGKLKNVFMHENPFECDCGLQGTWQWLKDTKAPVNKEQLLCASSYQSMYNGKRVIDLELGDLVCQKAVVQSNIQSSVEVEVVLVVTIMLLVLVMSIIAFAFVHRDKLGLVARRWQNKNPGREVLVPYTILLPSEKGKDITI
ncbi:hypothetical protein DPMN_044416 [Dreissena polymorpha]|uniref:LRRCT domain-containing protein n=2 Tax=Dreissena polymorpha TaxID=45954 RepID=A0A9D4D287_DREPO|nr:hypothetical protein DPMN_044416 [Dreissena polymorpha]